MRRYVPLREKLSPGTKMSFAETLVPCTLVNLILLPGKLNV